MFWQSSAVTPKQACQSGSHIHNNIIIIDCLNGNIAEPYYPIAMKPCLTSNKNHHVKTASVKKTHGITINSQSYRAERISMSSDN